MFKMIILNVAIKRKSGEITVTRSEFRHQDFYIRLAFEKVFIYNKGARRRSQVARQESAKLPFGGPNPPVASNYFPKEFTAFHILLLFVVEISLTKAVK